FMITIIKTTYNKVLKAGLLCLVFILGGLNKCFVEARRSLVSIYQAFASMHRRLVSTYEGFTNTHGALGSTHGTLTNAYRRPVGYPKNYVYQNKAPPH
ncbi:MAG TPA: hypothetical protein VF411_14975, partial [Bacteroidia bacterium]